MSSEDSFSVDGDIQMILYATEEFHNRGGNQPIEILNAGTYYNPAIHDKAIAQWNLLKQQLFEPEPMDIDIPSITYVNLDDRERIHREVNGDLYLRKRSLNAKCGPEEEEIWDRVADVIIDFPQATKDQLLPILYLQNPYSSFDEPLMLRLNTTDRIWETLDEEWREYESYVRKSQCSPNRRAHYCRSVRLHAWALSGGHSPRRHSEEDGDYEAYDTSQECIDLSFHLDYVVRELLVGELPPAVPRHPSPTLLDFKFQPYGKDIA